MRISEENGTGSQSGSKMASAGKETGLLFIVIKSRTGEFLYVVPYLVDLNFPPGPRREHLDFLISVPI